MGRPSGSGFSENANAVAPFAAQRSISRPPATGSHSGMMTSGMKRPGAAPHHSSIIQSLYACTHSSASSLSLASQKIWPQKRGNDGKHNDPRIPARSMSTTRAIGSYAAGRISEYGTGFGVNSSLRFPAVTESPEVGCALSSYTQVSSASIRGPTSRYLAGSRSTQTFGGSITWSSTETSQSSSGAFASIDAPLVQPVVEPVIQPSRHPRLC